MTDCASTPRRLLLIDDDPSFRTTISYVLQKLGHTVDAAADGFAGLALLGQKLVDLVLTDLMMPGLTGWEVARLAKAMHPRLPVVLVTGCAQELPPDQPERAWVDAILAKPCGVAALQTVIGALTVDVADTVTSGGPDSRSPTNGRGSPMSAPVSGGELGAPVEIRTMPSKRLVA